MVLGGRAQSLDISAADEPDATLVAVAHKSAAAEFSFADEQIDHPGTDPQHCGGFAGSEFLAPMRNVNLSQDGLHKSFSFLGRGEFRHSSEVLALPALAARWQQLVT